jgi:hypothetical protein
MRVSVVAAAIGMLVGPVAANAVPFTFNCLSDNSATDCGIGENQFLLDVTDAGDGATDFLFTNSGGSSSSIADIYFDWRNPGDALPPGTIRNGDGVSFAWGASPGNLPGGNNATPAFTADIGADSNAPTQPNGVNPGEYVRFRFFQTIFDNILAQLNSGDLRVGLHAQGFAGGGSETFITTGTPPIVTPPPTNVPEPTTLGLLGFALAAFGFGARRRTRN